MICHLLTLQDNLDQTLGPTKVPEQISLSALESFRVFYYLFIDYLILGITSNKERQMDSNKETQMENPVVLARHWLGIWL